MNYTIWLTEKCNMMCSYCYEVGNRLEQMSMSMETAKKVVNYIKSVTKENEKVQIHLHGGEVFENIEVLDYLSNTFYDCGYKLHLTTNGTMINNGRAKAIISRMSAVSISIDGDKSTYLKNRHFVDNLYTYDELLENVSMLLEINTNAAARITIAPNTFRVIDKNLIFLIKLGFKRICYAVDYYNNQWTSEAVTKLVEKLKLISKIRKTYPKILIEGIDNCIPHVLTPCLGGVLRQDIYVDGSIYPCTSIAKIPQFCLGNVVDGVIVKIEEQLSVINNHEMTSCNGCQSRSICRTNKCRYVNYRLTGNLYIPSEVMCRLQKEMTRLNENSNY